MMPFNPPKFQDACALLLQLVSDELFCSQKEPGTTALSSGWIIIPPFDNTGNLATATFLLDTHKTILSFFSAAPHITGYTHDTLAGRPFESLLAPESRGCWLQLQDTLATEMPFPITTSLTLAGRERQLLPCLCTFFHVPGTDTILASVSIVLYPTEDDDISSTTITDHHQAAFDHLICYIREHLDTPLPSTKKIALLLNTNEHTLKGILREHYGTTLHALCKEERLQKSRELVLGSKDSLKKIAIDCGFVSYPHFSRAFKKRFGLSPRDLQKRIPPNH